MSRGRGKRKGGFLPADSLQQTTVQKLRQAGKKLRIHAVFSALDMVI